jgi:hypothetical protein
MKEMRILLALVLLAVGCASVLAQQLNATEDRRDAKSKFRYIYLYIFFEMFLYE